MAAFAAASMRASVETALPLSALPTVPASATALGRLGV